MYDSLQKKLSFLFIWNVFMLPLHDWWPRSQCRSSSKASEGCKQRAKHADVAGGLYFSQVLFIIQGCSLGGWNASVMIQKQTLHEALKGRCWGQSCPLRVCPQGGSKTHFHDLFLHHGTIAGMCTELRRENLLFCCVVLCLLPKDPHGGLFAPATACRLERTDSLLSALLHNLEPHSCSLQNPERV